MNPDSAVAFDRKHEAQPFRSKVDGFLPPSRHRPTVRDRTLKLVNNTVRKRKMTLKFYSWTPSLLQGSASLAPQSNCAIRDERKFRADTALSPFVLSPVEGRTELFD